MREAIILSNLKNKDAKREDEALAGFLGKYFKTRVMDLFDDEVFSQKCFFLIRNIWDREGGFERRMRIYRDFVQRNIPHLNKLEGRGDQKGKRYLIDLYEDHRQVIPTFGTAGSALAHGSVQYLLKPIHGGSGKGIITVSAEDLAEHFDAQKHVIQPKIEFVAELSFFFVDSVFQHALKTKGDRWDMELYVPTAEELALARSFVAWNPIAGIQRIDFVKTIEHKILLLEIEDWCPYLSLLDVEHFSADAFIAAIAESIRRAWA